MKYIHLMIREKFTSGVVNFLSKYFNNGEHEVVYVNFDQKGCNSLIRTDVSVSQNEFYITNRKSAALCANLKDLDCDYIFVHSLFFSGREIIIC